eukprot:6455645-Amphidinium_carterae.1
MCCWGDCLDLGIWGGVGIDPRFGNNCYHSWNRLAIKRRRKPRNPQENVRVLHKRAQARSNETCSKLKQTAEEAFIQ